MSTNVVANNLFNQIKDIITNNRTKMIYQINNILVDTYFHIGKVIVEIEQNSHILAEYGKEILKKLAKQLTNRFGHITAI